MSAFLSVLSENKIVSDPEYLIETINLSKHFDVNTSKHGNKLFAVSSLKQPPLRGKRLFENNKWIILFAGDLVDCSEVPYQKIAAILEQKEFSNFKKFNSMFAILAFDKDNLKLYLVSDRRAQEPIYYYLGDDGLFVSTQMATFCRLGKKLKFNEEWLWEYLFFNYPIEATTFIEDVRRLSAASILEYDYNSGEYSILEYAEIFKVRKNLLDGKEALGLASKIFASRVPKYYEGSSDIACALTGGWDGRTILSLAPNPENVTSYTYGVPGCMDLEGARKTADLANIKHKEILFDGEFVKDLPDYMLETVFLSSGLERITRSTLLYVYDKLTDRGKNIPLTLSGIALDGIFKGHAFRPEIVSYDLARLFEVGTINIRTGFWSSFLKTDYSCFEKHILQRIEYLKDTYGDFKSPEHHLAHKLYFLYPHHFGGEMKIAGHFTTLRVPSLDQQIIELACSIKQSILSFSEFSGHVRGSRDELILQAYLLNELSPRFSKIPLQNTRPDIVLKGHIIYQFYRGCKSLLRRLSNKTFRKPNRIPLEDWNVWLNDIHKGFIDSLIFSKDSQIRKYINNEYLEKLNVSRDIHYISKLANTEIILRLIENNWERFW